MFSSNRAWWVAAMVFLAVGWSSLHHWDEFLYLYSALAHTPAELIRLEPHTDFFPSGFFSGKLGHLLLLELLVTGIGPGYGELLFVQAVYALLLLAFAAAAYGLLRELFETSRAQRAAIVLLFLPVTLYLAFKTLSEVPSLLFVTLAGWAFVRSFRSRGRGRVTLTLALATVLLALGEISRMMAGTGFIGLLLGLLAVRDARFPLGAVVRRGALVGVGTLLLVNLGLTAAGTSELRVVTLAYRVATRPGADLQRVYALALFVQAFALPLLAVAGRAWDRELRLATVWFVAAMLPFVAGHEPRFFAPALVPFAVLSEAGIRRIAGHIARPGHRYAWVAVLGGLVLLDRPLLAPLMPWEVDQTRLAGEVRALDRRTPGATYLIPWVADYSFLRFALPDARVLLCLSEVPGARYASPAGVRPLPAPARWWAGPARYVSSPEALIHLPRPWYYIGWTYRPAALRLQAAARHVGVRLDPRRLGLHDHLAGSWVWFDRTLARRLLGRAGQYQVYVVSPSA